MNLMFDNLKLDTRAQGLVTGTAASSTTTDFIHSFSFDCSVGGITIYNSNGNIGDKVTVILEYNDGTPETPDWKRYKKYIKDYYITPNDHICISFLGVEPENGMRLKVSYVNTGGSGVPVIINGYKFTSSERINMDNSEQGTDW